MAPRTSRAVQARVPMMTVTPSHRPSTASSGAPDRRSAEEHQREHGHLHRVGQQRDQQGQGRASEATTCTVTSPNT